MMKIRGRSAWNHEPLLGIFSCFIVVVLLFGAVIEPWIYVGSYNPDLLVLARYISIDLPSAAFEAFLDNTLYVYLLAVSFDNIQPLDLIILAQNISVFILVIVLLRYYNVTDVAAIVLITYFTVFLNQFRLGMALAICIWAFNVASESPKLRLFIICCSIIFHFFVAIWFLIFYLVDVGGTVIKHSFGYIVIALAAALTLAVFYSDVILTLRYIQYVNIEGAASQSFVLPVVVSLFFWHRLAKRYRIAVIFLIAISLFSMYNASISGRIAELTCYTIVMAANRQMSFGIESSKPIIYKKPLLPHFWLLLFALLFFGYRFVRWVFLDNVIIPPELLLY